MKTSKFLIIALALFAFVLDMTAQGLKVYKTDGEVITYLYNEVDSIVAFGYDDNNNNGDNGNSGGYEYVDLGLPSGTLWATCNVGATKPEEYGDYFAWGETSPKTDYSWSTYKWCNGSSTSLTKYNTSSSNGTVDNKTVLDFSDDAATVNWGSGWRMPTVEEIDELCDRCTWTWTTLNGVSGQLATGPNGNSIFLPAVGYRYGTSLYSAGSSGSFWSSSLYSDYPDDAYGLLFYSDGFYWNNSCDRYYGLSVRPVRASAQISPVLDVSAENFDFGTSETTKTLTISNTGNADLDWSVSEAAAWLTLSETSGILAVGESLDVTLTVSREDLASGDYNAELSLTSNGGDKTINVSMAVAAQPVTHEYVDLGLPSGTLWATTNVGATNPEDYGDYFALGETSPKTDYSWETYKWCDGTEMSMTKYCINSLYGTVDNKIVLDSSDDAATVNWGGDWRMPTKEQMEELCNSCTWTWSACNGVNGQLIVGPNYNSIFLPAAGSYGGMSFNGAGVGGDYRTSSLELGNSDRAYILFFDRVATGSCGPSRRCNGIPVRPVRASAFLSASSENFDFGTSETIKTLTISNTGNADLNWSVSEAATWLTLSETSGTLAVGESLDVTLTVSREELTDGDYSAELSIASNGGNKTINVSMAVAAQPVTHEYVDLGLPSGTLWATTNVGATNPEDYGDYFAWGETSPKTDYSWSTYKWCNGSSTSLTKYNTSSSNGTVDNKIVLDFSDDAATVNWGSAWRIPTAEEIEELCNSCTWTWTTVNGVNGQMVVGPNGNSIFLPAAGYCSGDRGPDFGVSDYGVYWRSSINLDYPYRAHGLYFSSTDRDSGHQERCIGRSVRPVRASAQK